jgi:hypothetical protein
MTIIAVLSLSKLPIERGQISNLSSASSVLLAVYTPFEPL